MCNLAITWTRATPTYPAELCVVMTNRYPDGWVLRHYLKRMHSEESFRDEQSGGFDLHSSHLADPKRLDTLLLALAEVAMFWMGAVYNFCRVHATLQASPAMAADLTDHVWSIDEFIRYRLRRE